jgi:hypothetical protein
VATPTLFLVGELEDPGDVMAEAAALMSKGTPKHLPGFGHINALHRSRIVLSRAMAFLIENAPG